MAKIPYQCRARRFYNVFHRQEDAHMLLPTVAIGAHVAPGPQRTGYSLGADVIMLRVRNDLWVLNLQLVAVRVVVYQLVIYIWGFQIIVIRQVTLIMGGFL